MITQYHKIALTAAFGLALSCSTNISCMLGEGGCRYDYSSSSSNEYTGTSSPSCDGGGGEVVYGDSVPYENQTYKTVKIGSKIWFQQNLNYAVKGSRCYGEDGLVEDWETRADVTLSTSEIQANCDNYGRLYDWAMAMNLPSKCSSVLSKNDAECAITTPNHRGICPSGWHIPSAADWNVLMKVANPSCSDNTTCACAGKKLKATSGWKIIGENSGNGTDDFGFAALPGGYGYPNGRFIWIGNYGGWWSASGNDASNTYGRSMLAGEDDFGWGNSTRNYLFSVRCVKDN